MSFDSRKSRALLLGLAFVGAGAAAQAQAARETVPVELVNAIFGAGERGAGAEFYVGSTPPGWPAALVPAAPARTLGGMRNGRHLVAVFVDSSSRDSFAGYDRLLLSAGFARPSSSGFGGFRSGGFQSSPGRYSFWCNDSSQVLTSARSSGSALTYFTVTYDPATPRGMCSGRNGAALMERERDRRFTQLAIPPLYAPPGVTSRGGGSGSGGTSLSERTLLDSTALTAAAVLQHYSAQLTKAGWTALATSTSTPTASQLFEARDELGRTWHGVLFVAPVGARRDVTLMMARPGDDDGMGSSSSTTVRPQR